MGEYTQETTRLIVRGLLRLGLLTADSDLAWGCVDALREMGENEAADVLYDMIVCAMPKPSLRA